MTTPMFATCTVLAVAGTTAVTLLWPLLRWLPRLLLVGAVIAAALWYTAQANDPAPRADGIDPWTPSGAVALTTHRLRPQVAGVLRQLAAALSDDPTSGSPTSTATAAPSP